MYLCEVFVRSVYGSFAIDYEFIIVEVILMKSCKRRVKSSLIAKGLIRVHGCIEPDYHETVLV